MAFQDLFQGHWGDDSRCLQFAALHFDVSVLEQYWSWSVGITVVAAPRDLILNDLSGSIDRLGITHMDLTPSLASLTHPDEMPSLCRGVFITGGEQLKQETLDNWGSKGVIYNAYGPTEATIGVTMYPRVPANGRPSNIGKQFANVGSYVLRPGTETPVLRGGVGELCVSGKLVGKGYLNRPQLTGERFPTLAEFGERVYRTGDLVRILHDGCFDFVGRADDQVKLRGQRLEMGEINHAIRTGAPDVKDVATVVSRHEPSGKDFLVSFLVGQPDDSLVLSVTPDTSGLGAKARAACLERLPGYMVPTYFLRVPYMPHSPNNKVETKKLKDLFGSLAREQLVRLAGATMADDSHLDALGLSRLIRILSDFGDVPDESLSPATSILDIGVDSVSALQLSAQLRNQGFPSASPAVLLRYPLVADLVRALSADSAAVSQANLVREARQDIQACQHRYRPLVCRELGIVPGDIEYIAPSSPLQQGIISKALADEGLGTYFNCFELQIDGAASMGKVRQAWSRLIDSHAILRSAFVNTADGHIQVALKRVEKLWEVCTAKNGDEMGAILETTRREWISRNRQHIMDPIHLVQVDAPGFQRVLVHIFHALYDGNSLELMNRYALALYHGHQPISGPPFVEALAYGPLWRHDHCRQFWTEHLRGWEPSPIPTPSPSPGRVSAVTATRNVSLGRLEELRAEHNVTLQSVVLAIWVSVLQTYLADKLTVGVVVAGRSIELPSVERTIGPLFNTVPFFSNTLQRQTWTSLIRKVHVFSTSIIPFQHVPLRSVQKWCSGGQPLFDNIFVFQLEQPRPDGQSAPWSIMDGPSHPDYPLAFEANRTPEGDVGISLVAKGQFADSTMLEGMLEQIERAMAAAQAEALVAPFSGHKAMNDLHTTPASSWTEAGDSEDKTPVHFEWTDEARLVRDEIASLGGMLREAVSATATISELGLDSIDVMKLSTRLKHRGISLSVSKIMRCKTISGMAQESKIAGQDGGQDTAREDLLRKMRPKLLAQVARAGLDMQNVESVLPPTALQESMVAGMIQSDFQWYFNHDVLEVVQGADTTRLGNAWTQVADQSPILRTGFVQIDDASLDMAYCQVIFRESHLRINTAVLSDMSGLGKIMSDAVQLAMHGNGVHDLVQVTLATLGTRRFFVLSMAHALYDGWSLSLMYQDLEAAYEGRGKTRALADTFVSRMLASNTAEAREFWANHLGGLSATVLGGKKKLAPTEAAPDRVLRHETTSSRTLSEVAGFCKRMAISLQVLCIACWAMVVAEQSQSLDVGFGVVLSGRDFEGAEDLMFPTMNTVAMRCILHGSVSGFLEYLQGTMEDVRQFQAFPLRKAQGAAELAPMATFNSLFLVQKSAGDEAWPDHLLRSISGSSAVDYPVCVEAEPGGNQLTWRIACHARLFSRQETAQLVNKLDRVLGFMLESEGADVLSFHDHGVSICGMPAVELTEAQPALGTEMAASGGEDDGYWDDTAVAVREILSIVSGVPVEAMQPSSTLYHLGLDSISAIKVSVLLRKRGIDIQPRELITCTSLATLASRTMPHHEDEQTSSQTPVQWTAPPDLDTDMLLKECGLGEDTMEALLPATPMQVYMLSVWQNAQGAVFCPEFRYRGAVDMAQVHEAWQRLTSAVAILRTRFIATGSGEIPWLQVIVKAEAMQSGRVAQPLIRFGITRDGLDDGLTIRLSIHHALYDGVSLQALAAQLCGLMHDTTAGSEQSISQWARHCIRPTTTDARRRRREFWTRYLQGVSRTSLPDAPRGGDQEKERTSYLDNRAMDNIADLRTVASQRGIGFQSLVVAAAAKCLALQQGCGNDSVVVGIYVANRTTGHDSPQELYPTLSLVPVKVQLGQGESLATIAEGIQSDMRSLGSCGRGDVGLWEVFDWTGVKVDSFVNFISLPDGPGSDSSDVALTRVHEAVSAPSASTRDLSDLLAQPWLQRNAVKDAFPASVEIEASVQGQGLAIGVFGPCERVSHEGAARMVASMVGCLLEARA